MKLSLQEDSIDIKDESIEELQNKGSNVSYLH